MTKEDTWEAESPTYDEAYYEQQANKEDIYLEETEEDLRAKLLSFPPDSSQSSEQGS